MARINKLRTIRLYQQMIKKAEEIIRNPERFKTMLTEARDVLDGKGSGPLREIADQLKLLLAMLNDYRTGAYRKIPARTIASVAGVILYLISPLDVIPDFVPVIGMIDDVFIVNFVWRQLTKDLTQYREWRALTRETRGVTGPDGTPQAYVNADFEPVKDGSDQSAGGSDEADET